MEVGRLAVLDGAEISNRTSSTGAGGNVSVIATDAMIVSGRRREGSAIFVVSSLVTNALGDGDGRLSLFIHPP